MTKQEFIDTVFDQLHICGCGNPEEVLEWIRDALRAYKSLKESDWSDEACSAVRKSTFDQHNALAQWGLHVLGDADLIEHGGSVYGSWITERGLEFLSWLEEVGDLSQVFDSEFFNE